MAKIQMKNPFSHQTTIENRSRDIRSTSPGHWLWWHGPIITALLICLLVSQAQWLAKRSGSCMKPCIIAAKQYKIRYEGPEESSIAMPLVVQTAELVLLYWMALCLPDSRPTTGPLLLRQKSNYHKYSVRLSCSVTEEEAYMHLTLTTSEIV